MHTTATTAEYVVFNKDGDLLEKRQVDVWHITESIGDNEPEGICIFLGYEGDNPENNGAQITVSQEVLEACGYIKHLP